MDAKAALSLIADQLDDLQSFADTFDEDDWGFPGRFGDEVIAEGDKAFDALKNLFEVVADVANIMEGRGFIDPQIDRLREAIG